MSTQKITKSFVDGLAPPDSGQAFHRDTILKGFAVRVTQAGSKAFVLEKRINKKLKRITLGRYPEITVEQARKMAQEYMGEIATGVDPIAKRQQQAMSNKTLWEVYIDYRQLKNDLKPKTYQQYDMYLNGALVDWKNKPFANITKDKVVTRHSELKQSKSPSYANNVMRVLSAMFKFAQFQYEDHNGNSFYPVNPVDQIRHLKAWAKEPRRQTIIKPHELSTWYTHLKQMKYESGADTHHVAADLIVFILLTGLRNMEGATLTWANVDFEDKTFHIPDTKNNHPLTLPMSDVVYALLKYRERFKINEYVFANRRTGFLKYNRRALNYLNDLSGITHTYHDLRRTFITVAESLDISQYAIKRLVNHSMSGC